jgi:casein kinase 1
MNSPGSPNRIINNAYFLKKKLSSGSYGVVFEAEDIVKKQMVAVKIEKKEKNATLDREIHILTRL